MNSRQLFRELRDGRIRPVYVCHGEETYLLNEFAERLIQAAVQPEQREMAVIRFDTAETPLDEILDEAETPPFFTARKVVLVRDAAVFGAGKAAGEVRAERLLKYAESPLESTVLVFLLPGVKPDERKKIVKAFRDKGLIFAFPPLSETELKAWLERRAERQGRTADAEAVAELLRRVGPAMGDLAAEMDKLCLHAGPGGRVDAEAVRRLVPVSAEQSVFGLAEEIAALRPDRAVALLRELLKRREEPIRLVALLVSQFRNMLHVKELTRKGMPQQRIASELGLHPYAVRRIGEQAARFSTERLIRILERLAELDHDMKTGRVDKALGLELFLLRTGWEGVSERSASGI
ncbi:MAG TPA: DNA polymerase III subunit delta [Paenibacillaceae bacterium]